MVIDESVAEVVLYLVSTSNHNFTTQGKRTKTVVLYLVSTSNHNCFLLLDYYFLVVLYLVSTSNHNWWRTCTLTGSVVLYLVSTSNHNLNDNKIISSIVVLYLVSTSNHNDVTHISWTKGLSYILFLHQTTTILCLVISVLGCLISCFYIKPQPDVSVGNWTCVVLYLVSTSNHNQVVRLFL